MRERPHFFARSCRQAVVFWGAFFDMGFSSSWAKRSEIPRDGPQHQAASRAVENRFQSCWRGRGNNVKNLCLTPFAFALCPAPDFDHIVDSDEMVFHPLADVETGGAGFLDDRLEMAAVHIAEHASKIAARPKFVARRVCAADGVSEWLDQSRTPA